MLPKLSLISRWGAVWSTSLRVRMAALSLAPLLLAFPLILAVLMVIGGASFDRLLAANARSKVDGARNYLEQIRVQAGDHLRQLSSTERLAGLFAAHVTGHRRGKLLDQILLEWADAEQFDFLVIAGDDGKVIASSTGIAPGSPLPDTYVVRQARAGVAQSEFERLSDEQLALISPALAEQARIKLEPPPPAGARAETRGLLVNSAVRLPLSDRYPKAILFGGILLNGNFALIDHVRAIVSPRGSPLGDGEPTTSIFLDDVRVATNVRSRSGDRAIGIRSSPEVAAEVLSRGESWVKRALVVDHWQIAGYAPIVDGQSQRIGMIYAGFPEAPYVHEKWLVLGSVAGLLALSMLASRSSICTERGS